MGDRRTVRLLVVLVALTAALTVPPSSVVPAAHADAMRVEDADDSAGRLDVAATRHGHHRTRSGKRWLEHRVRTYEGWPSRMLQTNTYIRLMLWRDRDANEVWQVWVRHRDGRLQATMYRGLEPTVEKVGVVRVRRPNRRTVTLSFPRRYVDGVNRYRWRALTSYERAGSPDCPPPDPDGAQVVPPMPTCPDRTSQVTHRLPQT